MAADYTLSAIAAQAGVSVSTVSKVRNGGTDVAPATRARIAALLRQHGHQVVSAGGFGVVDMLIGDGLHGPWSEELLRGAVEAADELGISILVNTANNHATYTRWLDRVAAHGTSGVLSVLREPSAAELRKLSRAKIPLVLIDPPREPTAAIRSVGTTNWQGGLTATRHLIELGHRRIAVISGPADLWSTRARLEGYRAALAEAGLPADERLVCRGDLSPDGAREATAMLLDLPDPPTAVVAANDSQAFGVLQILGERGLRAPRDLSVIGFDDVPIATWADPPLTTIRQPLAAMAATALRLLLSGDREPHHIELATTLVIRQSTGPVRLLGMPDVPVLRSRRSNLAVPGSSLKMIDKARTLPVDQLFLDLEDAVAPLAKSQARDNIVAALNEGGFDGRVRVVRVNDWTTPWTYRDVVDVVEGAGQNLDCIMLPKVVSAEQVVALDLLLSQIEAAMGYQAGRIGIEAQIEDPRGLIAVDAIAKASRRVETIIFGPADFMASINMKSLVVGEQPPGYDVGDAYHHILMSILIAARANGKQAIDGPYLAIRDVDGFRRSAARSAALGFDGKWVLHPDQIEAANEAYSPRQEDYDHAELILDAYDYHTSAEGGAKGAAMLGDEMIDEASRKMALVIAAKGRAAGLRRTQSFLP